MMETLKRLRQSSGFWGALGVFAVIFIGLTAASFTGTFLEPYTVRFRLVGVGGMFVCFVIAVVVLAVEPLWTFGRYLSRAIRASAAFVRENLLLAASLVTVALLLWRLFHLGLDLAVFSIVPLLVVACIAMTVGLIRLLATTRPSFLGLPAASAPTELELTYLGKAGDEVGPGAGQLKPDGQDDAAFLLGGDLRYARIITQIDLFRTDSEGNHLVEHWTSSHHGSIWQLGVGGMRQTGKEGVSRGPWIVPANERLQFLLYASDTVPPGEWFTAGQCYEVLVQHDGGPSTARTCLKGP